MPQKKEKKAAKITCGSRKGLQTIDLFLAMGESVKSIGKHPTDPR